jgi:hypothetical protein
MDSITNINSKRQAAINYGDSCKLGKELARDYLTKLKSAIGSELYTGEERHGLGDFVLANENKGIQVGFCYELIRQIEPLLSAHGEAL